MILHYIKIFSRNLLKNKSFSLINLIGLMTGITCCLLISLYVKHELGYDDFQQKGDRIARVIMEYGFGGSVNKGNYTSTKVFPAFKKNFPEVESGVRMFQTGRVVSVGNKLFNEGRFMYADSTFFELFSFRLLKGNPAKALNGPNNVVLTASAARKYFGSSEPVGKTIKVGSSKTDYMVQGVVEDCPANSQIKFDFLASFSTLGDIQEKTYWNANYTTYLLLKNEGAINTLQEKIPGFMKKEMSDLKGSDFLTYYLEPFKKIHLYSQYGGFEANGSITYLYIIGTVAILILAIACFTFINLSTSRSVERAKEIGIRKVSGAFKKQIFWQFLGESAWLSLIAMVLSYAAAALLLPAFNQLVLRRLHLSLLFSPFTLTISMLIVLSISFFAGAYPALILSAFQPAKVLKGAFKTGQSGLWLRKSLFVFQFVISVFLIVSTFIIQKQLYYIRHKDLGFNREHVIVLPFDQKIKDHFTTIKSELKRDPGILYVSKANFEPIAIAGGYSMRSAQMPQDKQFTVFASPVDEEYIKATGIHIIAGKDLTLQNITDATLQDAGKRSYSYILNRSAARQLGWTPQEAIGKKMFLGDDRPGIVRGVAEDFHFSSMHEPIRPLVLFPDEYASMILVKARGNNMPQTISFISNAWKNLVPHRPFEYRFMDEDYDRLYQSEMRLGKVMNVFTAIAMLLACLGLFGLSSYSIQQRTKEIGILKVLGAPVLNIVSRLSKNFLMLVLIAVLIAFPLAWYFMSQWLQDYSYRIHITGWIFFASGSAALLIALLTISFQTIKAAVANPVKSLRTE